ncbi:MAG: Fe-S cluster assembly protein SufD [Bacteroidetes bacterium]|nr:Fe-S cluster assembly protein SufD [Bacteroidota bacterium]
MSVVLDKPVFVPVQLEGEFKTLLAKTFSSEPEWLKEKRKEAFENFSDSGIPTRKDEEYKYTDVRKIFSGKFTAIHNEAHKLNFIPSPLGKENIQLVFINGWLHKDSTLSTKLSKGVIVGNLATDGLLNHSDLLKKYLSNDGDALAQLNSALWTDGAFIYIPENVAMENPIEIIHISTGVKEILASPRHLIIVGKNSSVSIIENNISLDLNAHVIVNSHADIFVGENSKMQFYRLQNDCKNASQISSINVSQEKNSRFDTNAITLGSEWTRNDLSIALNGENCESHLNGLFITNGTDLIDNHTAVHHNKPNCQSNQLYKGILDGKSTGIFNGKIFVERDAQKTNAYQSSKNILLSDDATINTKPQLEIYADDVKCSHGSTTGQLNEEALFYLRSRGLSVESARNLLLYAFANDVLNTIRIDSLKNYLEELVNNCLTPTLSEGEGVKKQND